MGYDLKYGKVTTERRGGDIPDDEIVVVFRSRDAILPQVLMYYAAECARQGVPQEHVQLVEKTRNAVVVWQHENGARVRQPDSSEYLRAASETDARAT